MISRDSITVSPWQADKQVKKINSANHEKHQLFDVLIIGGGITGLTTALLLQQQGKKCLILERGNIGFGTTGGTSAHLNTFFDATYPEIESDFGKENSKLVAKAGKEAFSLIKKLAKDLKIECDLAEKNAYLFAQDEKQSKEVKEILEASKRAGIEVEQADKISLPIPFTSAILFKKQGQFHPIKYIQKLAEAFEKNGGVIVERTFINEVEKKGEFVYAVADHMIFKAQHLVYATHAVPGVNSFSFKCAPYRSYVIGLTLTDENYPNELAYDMMEPYHYFRTHEIEGQKYLLVGGEDHKTGQGDADSAFKELESYVKQYFDVKEISYRWSSQYYVPADGLPYIGKMPGEENIYVATGFNGNGMMFGTLSGILISDEILGKKNEFKELFSAARIKPIAGFTELVQENANVAWHFVADRFNTESISTLKEMESESGTVADYNGEKLALYKHKNGKVTILNPVCTHAGCIVNFNAVEKSWDCPCHGGRFDLEGNVLCGPPRKNLERKK
ncbi:FAD-dependent oxidoreductase [Pedobacter sp. UC225_61]|uniref:FAD-dependent oxidoreductase n=1 Tax=Pedobacter sp. UC225_61 TaxID=3374623 RepID=UPI0037A571FF